MSVFYKSLLLTANTQMPAVDPKVFLEGPPTCVEACRVKAGDWFWKGRKLTLEWWSPVAGSKLTSKKSDHKWIKVFGIPLHAWSSETFQFIGDKCGGYVGVDEDTTHRTHMLWARICVKKNMKVIPKSIELLKEDWGFDLTVLEDLHTVVCLTKKATFLEKGKSKEEVGTSNLVSYEETQRDCFNSKEDSFTSKRDNLDCPVDRRAKVKESNNVNESGPVLNQLQVGLEADQIYYQTGPNGKRGKTKVLNEAKLFKLITIWQV
ncbi:hypothetical protein EJD97_011942, partial [Solanum chilense]